MSRFAGLMVTPSPPFPLRRGQAGQFFIILQKWRIVLFLNYFALSVIALENLPHSLNKSLTKPLQLCQGLFRALGCWRVCLCVYQLLVIFSVIMIGRRNLYAVGLLNQNDNDSPGNRPSLLHQRGRTRVSPPVGRFETSWVRVWHHQCQTPSRLLAGSLDERTQTLSRAKKRSCRSIINPLHLDICMRILHNALYTFPKALKRRICLPIKTFFCQ